jgi:2-oxo-3-hexenedioate decarboxylase
MSEARPLTPIEAIAREIADALAAGRQIPSVSGRHPGFGLEQAYAVTAELRRLRQARGEIQVGRKIGFTNRTIWAQYGVHAPIWGDMYDTTVRNMAGPADFPLGHLSEPLIEPEIVFGLARAPAPGMDEPGLIECIEWVAHGLEIVQSIFPQWKFTPADTVAANGLHGALLIGPRHRVDERRPAEWLAALTSFELALHRDGELIDRGQAELVLGGPLSALAHLTRMLQNDPHNPALRAGEIITTGTVTRAFPVAAGQTWSTEVSGIALDPLTVKFA